MKRSLVVLPLVVMGIILAACSVDSEAETAGVTGQLTALSIIDAVGFHVIDEELNQAGGGEIDPQWLGKVQHSRIAVATVEWPEELTDQVQAFLAAAEELSAALEADDARLGAAPAKASHETQHDLSADGWSHLAEQAGIELGAHDEGTATPASGG